MSVIAYTDRGGIRSYVTTFNNGTALNWSEHIADAAEFADQAAVLAFLSGKDAGTVANGQIVTVTAGQVNYGKKQH
jgi:hypothetical protein